MAESQECEPEDMIIPTRSFGGCDTCRKRHIKCDEGRPTCFTCQSSGVECSGYGREIFFGREDATQGNNPRFRRTMFTAQERANMSRTLVAMVPPHLATKQLSLIDTLCDDLSHLEDVEIVRGPFGAFRVARASIVLEEANSTAQTDGQISSPMQTLGSEDDSNTLPLDFGLPLPDQDDESAIDNAEIQDPDFFHLIDVALDACEAPEFLDMGTVYPILDFQIPSSPPQPAQSTEESRVQSWRPPSPWPAFSKQDSAVPTDAVALLKHYSTSILDILTPFRHRKTPWHILFIPHAKSCLAALTLEEHLDHASLCGFYAILTLSAFSLGGVFNAKSWVDQGKRYKHLALEHCGKMLSTAYSVPKAAKYKATLMALISMIQLALCLDSRDEADYFFIEAEKLIRLRGLKRHKSRKVRLLHYCYVFWRMFHESTHVGGTISPHRRHVIQAIESSELVAYSCDSLSFRLPTWRDLTVEMQAIKDQETAENDLHIELPGTWHGTLYPEIFGISEPWMFVLSLTVRLGKEKDASENSETPRSLPLDQFLNRAKSIEKYIGQLRSKREAELASIEHQPADMLTMQCLLDATFCAIEIYFYRRIYDLDLSLLQKRVSKVLESLVRCVPADDTAVHGSTGFIWPAFIAACEAEDQHSQTAFAAWFKGFSRQTGLHIFQDMLKMIERVWQEKNREDGTMCTWIDLARQGRFRIGISK